MSDPAPAIRPPQQRRSRESFERILEVSHTLIEENGFEGFTVQQVASRSGMSVGAIYERFQNKETLLRAVHARLMDEMDPETEAIVSGVGADGSAATAIADSVKAMARSMDRHRKALRAFMHFGAVDEQISARGSESSIALSHAFKAALLPYASEFTHRDPEIALDVAFRMTYSTLARQVMYGPIFESDRRLGWRRLVDEVSSACVAYLTCPKP